MNLNQHRLKTAIKVERSQLLPETQDEFEHLLNRLRPKATKIEVLYQYSEDQSNIGCLIYCDGVLRHSIEPVHENTDHFYQEHVLPIVEFYKNPPRLWPGCRGDIARACRQRINTQFNRWFDALADSNKPSHH